MLAALLLAMLGGSSEGTAPGARVFDLYQRLHPRVATRYPVVIVEIDERSLQGYGQWPWPRWRIAELLDRITAGGALAVGFDILFAEPDAASPATVLAGNPAVDAALAERLAALPDTDTLLAEAIARAPAVTARALVSGVEADAWRGTELASAPVNLEGEVAASLPVAEALIHALPLLEQRASGYGVLTADFDDDGVVRRMPLAWSIDGSVVPALAIEMLRVALGANWSTLRASTRGVEAIEVGDLRVETDAGGRVRPWFTPASEQRYLSAAAVLGEETAEDQFVGQLVLVGVTGLGTQDRVRTPLGVMNGTEVHAQAIENLVAGTLLERPRWGLAAELAASALAGLLLVLLMPRLGPLGATLLGAGVMLAMFAASYSAFLAARLLLDPSWPLALLLAVFVAMLAVMLTEYARARRELADSLEAMRLRAARISGELRAAGEIQQALLPDTRLLSLPGTLRAHALLEPARDIGGDLYDIAMIDSRRLFFVVGDVTGKGVQASLFMAISKALLKSAVLRAGQTLEAAVMAANAEISRENPAALFVTAFMGIVDAATGEVEFCNAGHENPLVVAADGSCLEAPNEGGPPFCVMDDYPYTVEHLRLQPGETLLIVTDGATEARSAAGVLLGHAALRDALGGEGVVTADPQTVTAAIRARVRAHEGGRRPTDDLTVMAIRYGEAPPAPAA